MTISSKLYQSLQAEACRMAEELPKAQLLDSLVATYQASRLLHLGIGQRGVGLAILLRF